MVRGVAETAGGGMAAVEATLVEATKRLTKEKLTRDALGVTFIQTGEDPKATEFLRMLDDGLEKRGATMDIVNCLTIDEVRGLSTQHVLERALDD